MQQRTAEVPVDVLSLVSRERVQQRTAEVPVDVLSLVSQERVQQRIDEAQLTGDFTKERISELTQILDVPVPQNLATQRERRRQRTVSRERVGGLSEQHRLVLLGVLFRSWTWTNTTIVISPIRRKRFGEKGKEANDLSF